MLIGILYGAVTGRLSEVTDAALSCAKEAVALCITMSGIVAMWMGIMQIARSSGLIDKMTEKMQPLFAFLFPKIPKEHPARNIFLLMSCKFFRAWLGCNTSGLKAMEDLQNWKKTEKGKNPNPPAMNVYIFDF